MSASIAIQVLPQTNDDQELCRMVDEVIAYIASTGLKYEVGPFETTIEGERYDELMDIAKECQALTEKVDASFVIDKLEFLHKGGRCSAVAALAAGVLQLKPCITVRGGKMGVAKKYRGKFDRVLGQYVADRIGDASDIDTTRVFVTHAGCDPEIVEQCVAKVKSLANWGEVHVTRAGCTVSAHCGRNTLGVLFMHK